VIRIDDLGRAEAINYHNLEYKPQDAEAKYFLSQFCVLYYRKNRYTIQNDFSKALYFLDGKLANGILDAYRKDDIIKKFLTNTSAAEIDVEVKKVALEDLTSPPYKARVDFYMVYYSAADHTELKRDLYTANFVFVFKTKVPNELIPINPLGLAITYFREDEAFNLAEARARKGWTQLDLADDVSVTTACVNATLASILAAQLDRHILEVLS
jgi:type IV secretion system protein VirB5